MVIVSKQERFIIIPYKVVIDSNLHHLDKLIYGEIISLSNKKGYCYANNKYFMEENKISKQILLRSLKRLEEQKYIKIIYKLNKSNSEKRSIFLTDKVILKIIPQ